MDNSIIIELLSTIRSMEARISELNDMLLNTHVTMIRKPLINRRKLLVLTRVRLYESLVTILLNSIQGVNYGKDLY